uniref:Uncharacterized protein n=1 Tax=Anguilla anguilla TaxID=7936 RepID=A0A0E9UTM9_ANGAN
MICTLLKLTKWRRGQTLKDLKSKAGVIVFYKIVVSLIDYIFLCCHSDGVLGILKV